ncbi:MAG TPA: hypothetical protein VMT91_02945 [Anaerolineales bacterium]|nr:hypothetical protein [Anaerolineales bacterium]
MRLLTKLATGWNILILLALFWLIILVAQPAFYPKFQTLDTLTSYSPAQAYKLIASYGDQGRHYYAVIECSLDLVYPFISALLFSLLTIFAFRRGFPGQQWMQWLALLPFAVMASDYMENICVVTMLLVYPRQLETLASLSNFFTRAKLALTPFELVFLIGLIAWPIQVLLKKSKA